MKARALFGLFTAALLGLAAAACSQDPIFYIISTETAPIPPRIEGAPTNMVVFEREYGGESVPVIYVASGRLHWYASSSADGANVAWDLKQYAVDQPAGKIIGLAATTDYLYALCLNGHGVDTTLRRIGHSGNSWETVSLKEDESYSVQSIYADPETEWLFAGSGKNNVYAILYLDNADDTLKMLKDDINMFSGVIHRGGVFYMGTKGSGIFTTNEADLAARQPVKQLDEKQVSESNPAPNNNRMIMGMIKLENEQQTIIAVERREGNLYEVNEDSFSLIMYRSGMKDRDNKENMATGRYATGALVLWEKTDGSSATPGTKLLIAGIQGGLYNTATISYTHGYVEFEMTADGSINKSRLRLDPGSFQSVSDNDRYRATIGKHPINHLFQAPKEIDTNLTFFASTQTAGLWSYRDRADSGGWQWNAEK